MGHKESAKKLLLAVATAGLTTCDGIGAVDPAPTPLECDDVSKGQTVNATGTYDGQQLAITIGINDFYGWDAAPSVTAVSGLTIDSVDTADLYSVQVKATLDAGAATGRFQVTGQIADGDTTCDVTRVFTVTLDGTSVEITRRDDLPLAPRRHASIELLRRDGLDVELRATGAAPAERVAWTPTAGAVDVGPDGRARWRLPAEPGVYQVEMLIDRGDDGFALDTLAIEVMG